MRAIVFERRLCAALTDAVHPGPDEPIVLAVSGGTDSLALLSGLTAAVRRDRLGWRLHVAHLDHNLRGQESRDDAAFVRTTAESLGLPCCVERLDPEFQGGGATAREERARQARYRFLRSVADRIGATIVVTAHHADDQAETVLHHAVRGSGLAGLAGMQAVRPLGRGCRVRLVRPMLAFRREELAAYVASRGLVARDDVTNRDLSLTRNRVRHRVMPMLATALNPRVVDALCRLARLAGECDHFLHRAAIPIKARAQRDGGDDFTVLDAIALSHELPIVRAYVLLEALDGLGAPRRELTFERLRRACELCDPGRGGRLVELPGGFVVQRVRRELHIRRASADRPPGADRRQPAGADRR